MILENALKYIEKNLFGKIDYDELAKICITNKYNVMRIFSASTDYTIAEYIRVRRLSEAGRVLAETNKSVIDVAFDCGYSTPESFSKAFKKFHSATPVECKRGKDYKFVPIWRCEHMNLKEYEVTSFFNKEFIGYGGRMQGRAENRSEQDEHFFISTRRKQDALRVIRQNEDCDWWEILDNFDENGFDFNCAVIPEANSEKNNASKKNAEIQNNEKANVEKQSGDKNNADLRFDFNSLDYKSLAEKTKRENYDNVFEADELKKVISGFKIFVVNGKYAKFTSANKEFPMDLLDKFTKEIYSAIDEYDFVRDETRAELLRIHWCKREQIRERHLEIFIPIK